jgi:hypothetical protein
MQDKRKLGKRQFVTVVMGERSEPRQPHYREDGPIYTQHQYFKLRHKHLKGSNRPAGWFHDTSSYDSRVEIRWLYTDELGYFGEEITFRPTTNGIKLAAKVGKALQEVRWEKGDKPQALNDKLNATVVEYVDDRKDGCWDDYRPLRVPGENPMMTIARYAQ